MPFKKAGRIALNQGRLQVEIDGLGQFGFDEMTLVDEDGERHGYAMESSSGRAVNFHMAGRLYTVVRAQFLRLVAGDIRKAAVFEVA